MRIFKLIILVLAVSLIFFEACQEFADHEKYDRPDWLAGKLYTQLLVQEDLAKFAECLRITGWDSILDVSGCFTIFAPSDEAVDQFLAANQYASVSDIPKDELEKIVEFHIVQNPWSLEQLQLLNIYGWIDPYNPTSAPNAYKRQTVLKNPAEKYWIKKSNNKEIIVMNSALSSDYKMVYTKSRKYIPIFFDEFFDIYNLSYEDYSFYFDRQFEPDNIYYAGAMVTQSDIIAENGFIHVVDRIVKPMLNAKELLERELPGETYKIFLELIYEYYPSFDYNESATLSQPAFRLGGIVDTLWDLSFPGLPFDIQEELTGNYTETRFTLSSHNGMYIPMDDAFRIFVDEILTLKSGFPHWPDLGSVPEEIIDIIVSPHFFNYPLYTTNISSEWNGRNNYVYLDEEDIIRKEFGSNCTFIGVGRYEPSRLFTSITGPVYLRPNFSIFRRAIQSSWIADELTNEWAEYSFFPISDGALTTEKSLLMEWIDIDENQYNFQAFSQYSGLLVSISSGEIRNKIRNQVGTSLPNGSANREFIRTLGGNYIIWDNAENTVQGSKPTIFGYEGDSVIICHPLQLGEPVDNGKVWYVNSWFDFGTTRLFTILSRFPTFRNLCERAGLYDPISNSYSFLNEGGTYTIFIPSDQALASYQVDTLSTTELKDFLMYHFVQGDRIFTDNKMFSGDYRTLRRETYSWPPVYSTLNIRTGPDIIEILDSLGNTYVSIPEAVGVTNIMIHANSRVTSVIHKIDEVLIKQ